MDDPKKKRNQPNWCGIDKYKYANLNTMVGTYQGSDLDLVHMLVLAGVPVPKKETRRKPIPTRKVK